MKRFFVLLLIAALIIGLLLFFTNPGLLDKVWIWFIGFLGAIIGFFRNLFDQIKDVFKESKTNSPTEHAHSNPSPQTKATLSSHKHDTTEANKAKVKITSKAQHGHEAISSSDIESQIEETQKQIIKQKETAHTYTSFEGTTITLVRFVHDQETTLGLLYLEGIFMCYTLEDTYRAVKVKKETRIPAGIYPIDFHISAHPSRLTQKYRDRKSLQGIFTHHLEVKNVPDFNYVYLHMGNDHGDTDGCILIANGISANTLHKSIVSSEKAYFNFYQKVKTLLEKGEKVRIIIHDEDWLQKI